MAELLSIRVPRCSKKLVAGPGQLCMLTRRCLGAPLRLPAVTTGCMGTLTALHEPLSGFASAWQTGLAVHAGQPRRWTSSKQLTACSMSHPEATTEHSNCKLGCSRILANLLCKLLSGLSLAARRAPWPAKPARLTRAKPSRQVFQKLSEHQRTDPHLCLRWPLSGLHLARHPAD